MAIQTQRDKEGIAMTIRCVSFAVLLSISCVAFAQTARLGESIDQYKSSLGEPEFAKESDREYIFQHEGWVYRAWFHNGKADAIEYRKLEGGQILSKEEAERIRYGGGKVIKKFAVLSDSEMESLLKLNGERKTWNEVPQDPKKVPRKGWETEDGSISAIYDVWDKDLHFHTKALTDRKVAEKRPLLLEATSVAKNSWDAGIALGHVGSRFLAQGEGGGESQFQTFKEKFTKIYAGAFTISKGRAAEFPGLPTKSGDHDKDYQTIVKFLTDCRKTALADFHRYTHSYDWGYNESACFDLGVLAELILLAPATDTPDHREFFMKLFDEAARKSGIPEIYWKGFLDKAKAGIPSDDIANVKTQLQRTVREYFADRQEELAPPGPKKS